MIGLKDISNDITGSVEMLKLNLDRIESGSCLKRRGICNALKLNLDRIERKRLRGDSPGNDWLKLNLDRIESRYGMEQYGRQPRLK